jgi:hypothetical protein
MAGTKGRRPGPALRMSPAGKIEIARAPSQDELSDLLSELIRYREAIPAGLFVRLRQMIEFQGTQEPWTWQQIHLMRWSYVCEAIKRGETWGDEGVYEYASRMLKGTPAQAGASMMKKSYDMMQRKLGQNQRRARTYRRRKAPLG